MWTIFFREWRVFALAVTIIAVTGLSSLTTIARQEDPTITNLFASVLTFYPGAGPERVEALVTEKIEEEVRKISEVKEIESTSRRGVSVVRVELIDTLTDEEIANVWSEVRDALSDAAVSFPPGVSDPAFDKDKFGAMTSISLLQPYDFADYQPGVLKRHAELLADTLRQLPGTKQVRVYGEVEEEIQVLVDPRKLAQLGVGVTNVSDAISRADTKVQAGLIRGVESNFLVEVDGEIDSLERVGRIPLGADSGGRVVRVSDIAEVNRAVKTPVQGEAYAGGLPAILIGAQMDDDLQVDAWMARIQRELAAFETVLPASIKHEQIFDQSTYTFDRLNTLIINILVGVGLVVTVLFFTLGWRGALIVACILPLTTLMTVSVLQFMGMAIHQMSVTGLIVALGLLVDAAIVMTDEIRRRLTGGRPRLESVEAAVKRLAAPLLASTVTTVLAFMPMILLPGPAGDFVGSIAISVVVMLLSSFLLALTITPALAGWMLPKYRADKAHRWWVRGVEFKAGAALFNKTLEWSLRHRRLTLFAAISLPLIGFMAFPSLTAQFFPGVTRDQLYVQLFMDGSSSIDRTREVALRANALIEADPKVGQVQWVIGEGAPAFYYNMITFQDNNPGFAEALITTNDKYETNNLVTRLQRMLDTQLPEGQFLVRGLTQGPPVAAPVEVRIVGPELAVLKRIGEEVRLLMTETPYFEHTKATLQAAEPKLEVSLDEDKVRQAGYDLATVAAYLNASLEGKTGGSLLEGTEDLPIRVRLDNQWRGKIEAVRTLDLPVARSEAAGSIGGTAYRSIPLSVLGEAKFVPSASPISRNNGERSNLVQGFIPINVLPQQAFDAFRQILAENPVELPAGYRIEYAGDADARSETIGNLMTSVGLIVTLTVATIVLTFNSFRLSLITGIVAILSMGMSLLSLEIFGFPFGIQALIGVIGSIGVSINAAIIIMTALQEDPRAVQGDLEAIREVVSASSRHIISTTLTTFGGFLPLIIEGGGFWPPFAMAVAGGVLLSTVVSFYFTPPAFLAVLNWRKAPLSRSDATVDRPRPKLVA